ncbi:MAG: hypothetical protein AB7O92_01005 [Acidimicrobiia bacterium]
MLRDDELLSRIAGVLRHDVGPQVQQDFAKTQAFMAGVILDKVAGQLRHAVAHHRADRADAGALAAELQASLQPGDPASLRGSVEALHRAASSDTDPADNPADEPADNLAGDPVGGALHVLVTELYAARAALGAERFDALLGRTRTALRARLDRQLAYSR